MALNVSESPNIIEASWQTLVDALNFGLIHSEHDDG